MHWVTRLAFAVVAIVGLEGFLVPPAAAGAGAEDNEKTAILMAVPAELACDCPCGNEFNAAIAEVDETGASHIALAVVVDVTAVNDNNNAQVVIQGQRGLVVILPTMANIGGNTQDGANLDTLDTTASAILMINQAYQPQEVLAPPWSVTGYANSTAMIWMNGNDTATAIKTTNSVKRGGDTVRVWHTMAALAANMNQTSQDTTISNTANVNTYASAIPNSVTQPQEVLDTDRVTGSYVASTVVGRVNRGCNAPGIA